MTDEEIENIKKAYKKGSRYSEIEEKYNITHAKLVYMIRKYKWKRKNNRSKVMKNNKNAVGNKGGHGPGKKNQNALVTGEYQTIYDDLLTNEEKDLLKNFQIEDKKLHIISELKILTIRERRILNKIDRLQRGKELSIVKITKSNSQKFAYKNDGSCTTTEAESNINITQRFEEALTRVQEAKRRYIDSYHKIENDNRKLELELIRLERDAAKDEATENENAEDDSFIKALEDSAESAWNDYENDESE